MAIATINPNQDYDCIHTLTFEEASGSCKIRLYFGSTHSTFTGDVYIRAGTSGSWTRLGVSGIETTFPVTSKTMQVGHSWINLGNYYMTPSFFEQQTNLQTISISQKSTLSGIIDKSFMVYYAYGCSSVTSIDVPDIAGVTHISQGDFMAYFAKNCTNLKNLSVPDTSKITTSSKYFMYHYAMGCTNLESLGIPSTSSLSSTDICFMSDYAKDCISLERLELPAAGYFRNTNVDWSVPPERLGSLKGYVINPDDLADWKALTTSGKTLYINYIRDPDNVICEVAGVQNIFLGDRQITDIKIGSRQIKKVTLGSRTIWEK